MNLSDIWKQQETFNLLLQSQEKRTRSEWVTQHALGLVEETMELLRVIDWKLHRVSAAQVGSSAPWELADLTKYVLSLWQDFGLDEQEMLEWVALKSSYLSQMRSQEHPQNLVHDQVIVCDMDGVLADFRAGFMDWLAQTNHPFADSSRFHGNSIHMDVAGGWESTEYQRVKEQFEHGSNGYLLLPKYGFSEVLWDLKTSCHIVLCTARPRTTKVISDTWRWVKRERIVFDEIHIGESEGRISRAKKFLDMGKRVVLIDDDPTLLRRARTVEGLKVVKVRQYYNAEAPCDFEVLPEFHSVQVSREIERMLE